ncbi:cupin domain-containing protein [Marinomonas balearica]|uniref:ChrR-like anti-ECFsigma factor n=1 Tax=Marinomonas balearica TaxID=491947 RepID=A0A4R6M8G4_9GAMM|nr:cupin domain-containing protein [Marinomonas balearica]TDO96459.1 ChrR-like anti-ECFsigma factor [Marinomonas balearica]
MLNMNFAESVFIDTAKLDWKCSPMAGVERKPLARESAERGHATSIVRYAPKSFFRPHPHPLGEEILVLSGVFSDEMGEFPAGTYFRNPPGTSHAPHSDPGCVLLVKLHQFKESDLNQMQVSVKAIKDPKWKGVQCLYEFESESVCVCSLEAGDRYSPFADDFDVAEIFIIDGHCEYDNVPLTKHSWLRTPCFDHRTFRTTTSVIFWIKQGHFSSNTASK